MPINLDNALGINAQALTARSRRADILAANLANVDTPGFKARDVDFRSAMRAAESQVALAVTQPGHVSPDAAPGGELLYRQPLQPAVDGNTVDAHVEKAEFMRNSMMYQASLTFLGARINGLLSAIRTGE